MSYRTSIQVSNSTDKEIIFHLEPWCEQIKMTQVSVFQVGAEAKDGGELEVEYGEDRIVVWGWPSSILTIFCNGKEIGAAIPSNRPRVPSVPKGTRVSSFIRLVEGKK